MIEIPAERFYKVFGKDDESSGPVEEDERIPVGGRNSYLTGFAGVLVGHGITGSNLEQHLRLVNEHQLEEKLPETEFQGILKSAGGWESSEQSEPPLKLVDIVGALEQSMRPPKHVIEDWLPRGLPTLMGAHGGAGKTFLALVMAAHVCCGEDFAGQRVEQGKVLFVTLEDQPWLICMRMSAIIEVYDLDEPKVWDYLTILDGTEQFAPLMTLRGDGNNAKPMFTTAYDTVREHAPGYDLIIIDNASDAFDANENVRRHVRQFMHGLTQIARELSLAMLLLAHIDKNAAKHGAQGNSYSGSTAWHNSARSRLAIVEEDRQRFLRHEKNNFGPLVGDVAIDIAEEGVPMLHVLPMQGTEENDREELLACFAKTTTIIPAKVTPGNGSAMQALETVPDYPKRFQSRDGKRRVGQLITQMLTDGVLHEVEYKDDYRNKRRKLAPTPDAGGGHGAVDLVRQ